MTQNKVLLSVREASQLFGIGQHRIRDILQEDYDCKYHLMIGRIIKIKRRPFEEYVEMVKEI